MCLYFALSTVENNKKKKSVKFQGDTLNFCDFILVYVFTTNHHLNLITDADGYANAHANANANAYSDYNAKSIA